MTRPGMGVESRWSGEIDGDDIVWTQVPQPEHVPPVEGQLSLLGDSAGPVRPTDPETSAEAAALPGRMTQRQRVLRLLASGPRHDELIGFELGIDKGSAAKRRGELVDALLAEPARDDKGGFVYSITSHGARTLVWQLTEAGRKAAMES